MFNVDSKAIQKLYIAYFGRPGDPSGINYWLSRTNEKLTLRDISNELSRQDEYTKSIAIDKSLEFRINKIYLNLFDRKADFDGLNYWLDMINKKDCGISDVVYNLIFSNHIFRMLGEIFMRFRSYQSLYFSYISRYYSLES